LERAWTYSVFAWRRGSSDEEDNAAHAMRSQLGDDLASNYLAVSVRDSDGRTQRGGKVSRKCEVLGGKSRNTKSEVTWCVVDMIDVCWARVLLGG